MGRDNFVAPTAPVDILADVLGGPRAAGPVEVPAGKIKMDGGTQMRAGTDDATVFEYGQAMIAANGWGNFPAVIAYHDGKDYWLADGFHRVAAFLESFPDLKRTIPVEVRAGTRRDAVLHAAGANASHGLRRTNQDKRRAVETLLRDEEWGKWNNSEIARRCIVSESLVRTLRDSIFVSNEDKPTERLVTRGGTTYTQNTAKIGTRPASQPVPVKPVYTPVTIAGNSEPTPGTPIPQRVWTGITCHTWDGYADWNSDDEAEYAALNGKWQNMGAPEFNYLKELDRITRWRVAARLATQIFDNRSGSLQEVARVLRNKERSARAVLNTPAAEATPVVTLDELEVIDSVTVPVVSVDPDEEITHPLDCYDDEDVNPFVGKMGKLHELKMWLKATRDEKTREYRKLTNREIPALFTGSLDHMIAVLEETMDAVEQEAVAA